MKIIKITAIILTTLNIFSILNAELLVNNSHNNADFPSGSYQFSCDNARLERTRGGSVLKANCDYWEYQAFVGNVKKNKETQLARYWDCADIVNRNGELECIQ